jgi:uncharacterized protein (DUF1015 family)
MAEIAPFRALRYDPQLVPDLSLAVAPPYDVITPEAQERYYARHPRNVVRLILAKDADPEAPGQDRYTRAAQTFADWQARGVLRRDPDPGLYLYEQEFSLGEGPRLRRRGFLALVRLEEYEARVIIPHERTFARYKDDRLRLMRACRADLEPILGFYPGPATPITAILDRRMEAGPAVEVQDEEGIRHRLWVLRDAADMEILARALQDRPIVIADGHHRFETALNYRNERRAQAHTDPGGRPPEDFVLMNLIHAEDPGLVILPTHRVIRQRPAVAGEALRAALKRHFRLRVVSLDPDNAMAALRVTMADLQRRRQEVVGFAAYTGGQELLLGELEDQTIVRELTAAGHSPEFARLDVAILHHLVIERLLGVQSTGHADAGIEYTRDEGQALTAVNSGAAAIALLLTPPRVGQVQAVAMAGDRMPQKSTFFFPKVLSGLVLQPLNPAEQVPALLTA